MAPYGRLGLGRSFMVVGFLSRFGTLSGFHLVVHRLWGFFEVVDVNAEFLIFAPNSQEQ